MVVALPELPDDRRAQPRRYAPAIPPAPPRTEPPTPPRGRRPVPPPGAPRPPQQPPGQQPPVARYGRPVNGAPPGPPRNGGRPPVGLPQGARPLPPPARRAERAGHPGQNGHHVYNGVPVPPREYPAPPPERPAARTSSPDAEPGLEDDPTDSAAEAPEAPGRHRRRMGESPGGRPAASYAAARPEGRKAPRTGRRRRPTFWKELPLLVVVALLLTFLIQTFLAKVYVIPSGSMEATLHGCAGCNNDRVLVDKISYRLGEPQPGDVVVFRGPGSWRNTEFAVPEPDNPLLRGLQQFGSLIGLAPPNEKDFVKRVIATGGQTVACCDSQNRVLVDGEPLSEPYLYYAPQAGPPRQDPFGPVTVPQGQLWMMGDSRNNSADSRVPGHGAVPEENVIGQARLVVLPFGRFGWIPSPDPQTTAVGMGADRQQAAPVALGLLGALPLLAGGRRIARREGELGRFLPARDR